ncbi:cytochrome P450 [Pseudochelatococcus sp. B33]
MSDLAKVWETPPVACPAGSIGHDWDPFDHRLMYELLSYARESEPVFFSPELEYWVVTRYSDVLAVLHDPARFSAANVNTPITPIPVEALRCLQEGGYALEGVQVNCDPPRHTRIRRVVSQAMTMRHFKALEGDIRALARAAIDRLRGRGRVDLLRELTYDLPAHVIFRLLDIPESDTARVKAWAADRMLLSFSRPSFAAQMQASQNLLEFWHFVVALVAERQRNPGRDFIGNLLKIRGGDDNEITLNELTSVAFGLLFAGHETTTSQMTNTLRALLTEPGLWAGLGRDPDRIGNAIEEGLRLYGAVANWRRRVTEPAELGGVALPVGSPLVISFAAANRDPEVFEEPDRFRLDRKNSRRHLTFGNGIHSCLGAPLARLEMQVLLEELLGAFPDMRLGEDAEPSYARAFAFRVPDSLWVELGQ